LTLACIIAFLPLGMDLRKKLMLHVYIEKKITNSEKCCNTCTIIPILKASQSLEQLANPIILTAAL
jgi:hypothetical protein